MALEDNTKKALAEMVRALEAKVKELQTVEKQQTAVLDELKRPAIGLHKDEKGKYHLVHIKYDIEKNAAAVEKLESLSSADPAIALWNLKKFVAETIMRKARGGKYD